MRKDVETRLSNSDSSSLSSDMQELETFTKARLPRMLEANLRPMIGEDLASLEPRLRQLLPGIVEGCQAAINQSFQAWRDLKTPFGSSSNTDVGSGDPQAAVMSSSPWSNHNQDKDTMHEPDVLWVPDEVDFSSIAQKVDVARFPRSPSQSLGIDFDELLRSFDE